MLGKGSSLKAWSVTRKVITVSHLAEFKEHLTDVPEHGLALGSPPEEQGVGLDGPYEPPPT